jgi:hypothetical protein
MKAVLKYPLYRRPQPSNEGKDCGYLLDGSSIEVVKMVAGKAIDGISIWFFADDGFYYWGGGAEFTGSKVFLEWDKLSIDMQKALLQSLIADETYWFEKKAIGYIGCGWGFKNDSERNGVAVTVFVSQKTGISVLPKTVRYKGFDIPIDVKPVKSFKHHVYINHKKRPIAPDIFNPMQAGGSISLEGSEDYGTRSMVLKNKIGIIYLMTCFHVLLDQFKSHGKFPVDKPRSVTAEVPSNACNPFQVKLKNNLNVIEGRYTAHYDFAMVKVTEDKAYKNSFNNIEFNSFYLIEELKSLVGQTVIMAGATSSLQSGKVLDVQASLPVNDTHVCKNIVVTEMISKGGDSGAPVIDKNGKLVGIVVSGNEKDKTLVLPVTFLFTQLGYQFI